MIFCEKYRSTFVLFKINRSTCVTVAKKLCNCNKEKLKFDIFVTILKQRNVTTYYSDLSIFLPGKSGLSLMQNYVQKVLSTEIDDVRFV